jgi:hypothetical protein
VHFRMIMNENFNMMRKETTVAYFKLLTENVPERIEAQEISTSVWPVFRTEIRIGTYRIRNISLNRTFA